MGDFIVGKYVGGIFNILLVIFIRVILNGLGGLRFGMYCGWINIVVILYVIFLKLVVFLVFGKKERERDRIDYY